MTGWWDSYELHSGIQDGCKSIRSNKVRSFLTMLGVIIGVSSVIAAVGFAQGSTKSITDTISSMGTNLIQVNIMGRNSNRNVTYSQIKKFSEENSDDIAAVAPQSNTSATVKYTTKQKHQRSWNKPRLSGNKECLYAAADSLFIMTLTICRRLL